MVQSYLGCTVQEVDSAQTAVVICGLESIRWEVLPDALTRIVDPFFAVHHMEAGKTRYSLENIFAMERARRFVNGTFPLPLFEILLATSYRARVGLTVCSLQLPYSCGEAEG